MKISIMFLLAFLVMSPDPQACDEISEELLRITLSDNLVNGNSEEWEIAGKKIDEYYCRYEKCLLSNVMDVHKFNVTMEWDKVLPVLMKIDTELLGSNFSLSYKDVEKNIKESTQYKNLVEKEQKKFDQEFLRLEKHLSSNVIEVSETRVNVQELLSRIWSLSGNFGVLPDIYMIYDQESAINFLITSIKTNIFEGGGCYQGYAGRLALNYLMLLRAKVCLSGFSLF